MRGAHRIVMTKWPDRPRSDVSADFLGEDEHGVWYGSHRDRTFVDGRGMTVTAAHVGAYLPDRWWIPIFVPPERRFEIYVHIATPPDLVDGRIESIDLELDVVRYRDRRVEVLDEDELDEAIIEHAIPDDVVGRARGACDEVVRLLTEDVEPFARAGAAWLERYLAT